MDREAAGAGGAERAQGPPVPHQEAPADQVPRPNALAAPERMVRVPKAATPTLTLTLTLTLSLLGAESVVSSQPTQARAKSRSRHGYSLTRLGGVAGYSRKWAACRHSVQYTLPGSRRTGFEQPSSWQRLPPPCASQWGGSP